MEVVRIGAVVSIAGCLVAASACGGPDTAQHPTTSTSGSVVARSTDPYADRPLIDHTTWTTTTKGQQLEVFSTHEGRVDTYPAAGARAWSEIVATAPDADLPGMRDQFFCHWAYARIAEPDKPSWNLEPWRPDVGPQATMSASCNPGGPEE